MNVRFGLGLVLGLVGLGLGFMLDTLAQRWNAERLAENADLLLQTSLCSMICLCLSVCLLVSLDIEPFQP